MNLLQQIADRLALLDQHQRIALADVIDSPNPNRSVVAGELLTQLQRILPEISEEETPFTKGHPVIAYRSYPGFVCFDGVNYLNLLPREEVATTRFEWRGPVVFNDLFNAGYTTTGTGTDTLTVTLGTVTESMVIARVPEPTLVVDVATEAALREQCTKANRFLRIVAPIEITSTVKVSARNIRITAGTSDAAFIWAGVLDKNVPMFSVWAGGFACVGVRIDMKTLPPAGSREAPIGFFLSGYAIGVLLQGMKIDHIGTFVMANGKPSDVLILDNTVADAGLYNNFIWNEGICVFMDGNMVPDSLAEHIARGRKFFLWAMGPRTRYGNKAGGVVGNIVKGTWVMQGGGRYASCSGGLYEGPFDPRPLSGDDGVKDGMVGTTLEFVRVADDTTIVCPPNCRVTIGHRTHHVYFGACVKTATGECIKVTGHDIDSNRPEIVAQYGLGKISDITIRQGGLTPPPGAQPVVFCDNESRAATKIV